MNTFCASQWVLHKLLVIWPFIHASHESSLLNSWVNTGLLPLYCCRCRLHVVCNNAAMTTIIRIHSGCVQPQLYALYSKISSAFASHIKTVHVKETAYVKNVVQPLISPKSARYETATLCDEFHSVPFSLVLFHSAMSIDTSMVCYCKSLFYKKMVLQAALKAHAQRESEFVIYTYKMLRDSYRQYMHFMHLQAT